MPLLPRHEYALRNFQLPRDLVDLIRSGQLTEEVERMERAVAAMNERLDAWEAANPEAAALAPWHDEREKWKAAGRPAAHWADLLALRHAVNKDTLSLELWSVVPESQSRLYWRYKADPEKYERYRAHRRAAELRNTARRPKKRQKKNAEQKS